MLRCNQVSMQDHCVGYSSPGTKQEQTIEEI